MDREAAIEQLGASDADLRLRAARVLGQSARPADEAVIRARRRVESVPWIRAALEQALTHLSMERSDENVTSSREEPGESDLSANYMAGLQLTTDRIVHELRSIVGTLRYWAQKEQPSYSGSETERQVERLRRCLEAIDVLGKVAHHPSFEHFDLAQLIDEEAVALAEASTIQMIGRRPFLVRGDRGLLALVLRNAMRNGIEAAAHSVPEVHVNWGDTHQEYWIAVFDRGSGLPVDPEALFDFGSSTKVGHVGAGLAIVAQAAVAVGGEVSLTEEADRTTKFEFRWPRS